MHAAPLSPRLVNIHEPVHHEAVKLALSKVARQRIPVGARDEVSVLRPERDTLDIDQLEAQGTVDFVRGGELLRDERRRGDGFTIALRHVKDHRNAPRLAGAADRSDQK